MPLTNAGLAFIAEAITGEATALFDDTNGHLGVGDSTAAFDAAQTNLQAATNKVRVQFDAAPDVTGPVITAVATFDGSTGNFDWEEFGLFNHASAGTMFSRVVDAQGTKGSGQVWELTYEQTLVNGDA